MENNITRHSPPSDGGLAKRLADLFEHAKLHGKHSGIKSTPVLDSNTGHEYFRENHLRYQSLIHEYAALAPYQSSIDAVVEHRKSTTHKVRDIDNKVAGLERERIGLNSRLPETPLPDPNPRKRLVGAVIVAISLLEGVLSRQIWESYQFSYLFSNILALMYAVVLAALAFVFIPTVRKGRSMAQRTVIAVIFLTALTIVFSYFAINRSSYIEAHMAQAGLPGFHVNPVVFIVLSLILFLSAVAVKAHFYPAKEHLDQFNREIIAKSDLEKNRAEQLWLEKEKQSLLKTDGEFRQETATSLEQASNAELRIISHAHQAYESWKTENASHRFDGIPVWIHAHYPFDFETHFHHLRTR